MTCNIQGRASEDKIELFQYNKLKELIFCRKSFSSPNFEIVANVVLKNGKFSQFVYSCDITLPFEIKI